MTGKKLNLNCVLLVCVEGLVGPVVRQTASQHKGMRLKPGAGRCPWI